VENDANFSAITGEGFVDTVIDHFEYHVMQSGTVVGVTDIHPGPFADRVQALQHFNL
jgi:hypothetical protein